MAISLNRFIENNSGLQGQANGGGLTSPLHQINFINGGATTVAVVQNGSTIDVTITSTDTTGFLAQLESTSVHYGMPSGSVLPAQLDIPTGWTPILALFMWELPFSNAGIGIAVGAGSTQASYQSVSLISTQAGIINWAGSVAASYNPSQFDSTRIRLNASVATPATAKMPTYVIGAS